MEEQIDFYKVTLVLISSYIIFVTLLLYIYGDRNINEKLEQNAYNWQIIEKSKQCENISIQDMELRYNPHKTNSMLPTINYLDKLLIIPYNSSRQLMLGDIVSNGEVLHRIERISYLNQNYWLKGDNNRYADTELTNFNQTKYIVCGVLR